MAFVVTAGPTREHIDPVRFLSNPSTGKMGFAIARAAAARGHDVTLVAGPVSLRTPRGARRIDVTSAREMLAAVMDAISCVTDRPVVFVSTAAVADWRPAKCAPRKLKKGQMSDVLKLVRNPDILKTVSRSFASTQKPLLVGFAAETGDPVAEAKRKCRAKGLELVVANDVTEKGAGFGTTTNHVTIVRRDGTVERLPMMTKAAVARRIVRVCEGLCP